MFDDESSDLTATIQQFIKTGGSLIELLNHGLESESLLQQILAENKIFNASSKLPGLIVQVYLVLVKNYRLDVFDPISETTPSSIVVEDTTEDIKIEVDEIQER